MSYLPEGANTLNKPTLILSRFFTSGALAALRQPCKKKAKKVNEVSIFDFGDSAIRTLAIDNRPYFVGRDIASALGYSNTKDALSRHCRGVVKHDLIDKLGREQEAAFIPESDLYRLIFNSKLPAAMKFEEWVTNEVLPSLRQTGEYSLKKDEEIDDIPMEYDETNIQVAEFELRAIKIICQLFGRDAARSAYMASKHLPKPIYAVEGQKDASAFACLEYLKTMFVSNYPICRVIDSRSVEILKPAGIDLVDDMVAIATSSKEVARHFANSRWANGWVAALLELPRSERGKAAKRFAGITAKYILVPTFYFRENNNAKN